MEYIPKKVLKATVAISFGIAAIVLIVSSLEDGFIHMVNSLTNWNGPTIAPR
ncbi:hypothetical protein ACXZ7E_02550 [Paenibacillus lautus]